MRHTLQPPSLTLLQHLPRQSNYRLLMGIMRQHNIPATIHLAHKLVKTQADPRRLVVLVVLRVDAALDHLVSEIAHHGENIVVDFEIRWAHVGGCVAHDGTQGVFESGHLLCGFCAGQGREAQMGETVGGWVGGLEGFEHRDQLRCEWPVNRNTRCMVDVRTYV